MLSETSNKNSLRYPALLKAWDALPKRSLQKKKILTELGLERSYVWRLLRRTHEEQPMRAAYLTVLKKELGLEVEVLS